MKYQIPTMTANALKIYHNRYKKIFNVAELTFDKEGKPNGGKFFFGKDKVDFNINEVDVLPVKQ